MHRANIRQVGIRAELEERGCRQEISNTLLRLHQCTGLRKSVEGYHPSINDITYMWIPCQYIRLAECGCGPPDVYDFGLGKPNKTCQTEDDCRFLCEDVPDKVKDLCYAFDFERWEGKMSGTVK